MGDTVTNHELLVATKGSGHYARTEGDTDVCFNPTKTASSPHENFVSTKQLGAGQTTKTFIQQKPIVTTVGVIEPSSHPAHTDTGGGVKSSTYRKEAKPTAGSPDVTAEGNPVCRTDDPTTQNHANTTGKLVQPSPEERLRMEEEEAKPKCTMVKVVGQCAGPGTPDMSNVNVSGPAIMSGNANVIPAHNAPIPHGRELYFPPNGQMGSEGYYLEVLSTDTVTLNATRENAVEKGPPACIKRIHTLWVITRSGAGEDPEEDEVSGDTLVLDEAWFKVPAVDEWGLKPGSRSKDKNWEGKRKAEDVNENQKPKIAEDALKQMPRDKKEQEVFDRRAAGHTNIGAAKRHHADRREAEREKLREKLTDDRKKANKSAQNTVKAVMNIAQNAAKLYYYWNYMNNPVTLDIQALACTGSKNVKLLCYPVGKFEWDLFSDKIAENVNKIRLLAALFQKIAAIFRARGNFKFLQGPQLLLTTEFKELKENKNGFLKSQVRLSWELSIGFEKLIEFAVEFGLPLLNFFGPMGAAANLFLNAFGIEGNAYISLAFGVNPRILGRWTEYNECIIGEFKMTVKVEVQIGARARFRDIAEIYAAGYVEASIEFTKIELGQEYLCKCYHKGALQIGIKAGGYASWWGFSKSFEINYKPPDWKYSLGEGDFQFVKLS